MDEHDEESQRKNLPSEQPSETEKILGRPVAAADTESPAAITNKNIDPKWETYHQQLLETRDYLLDQELSWKSQGVETQPKDRQQADAESATTINMRDMSLANTSSYQEMLDEVNEALARIEDGRYGVCELSGKQIPEKRLRAVPWTRYTLESEEQLEREGKVPFHFQLPQSQRLKGSSETIIAHSHEVHEEKNEQPGSSSDRA